MMPLIDLTWFGGSPFQMATTYMVNCSVQSIHISWELTYLNPTLWQEEITHLGAQILRAIKTQLLSKWKHQWLRGMIELYNIWMHNSYYAIHPTPTYAHTTHYNSNILAHHFLKSSSKMMQRSLAHSRTIRILCDTFSCTNNDLALHQAPHLPTLNQTLNFNFSPPRGVHCDNIRNQRAGKYRVIYSHKRKKLRIFLEVI
jgi:hypothetical protein